MKTAIIEPASPCKNVSFERLDVRSRNELLDGEVFHPIRDAQIRIKSWHGHYNIVRPRSARAYRPPAPESILVVLPQPTTHGLSKRTAQVEPITNHLDRRRHFFHP
ncbi:integrase core domain-containing protein [Roseivivax sp. GX 12232]|uniref:integrase core domain-containing protein n=1 Tax=Roseivivax sp. GX 12232 TaxID=2900547 RepID=UPI00351D654A